MTFALTRCIVKRKTNGEKMIRLICIIAITFSSHVVAMIDGKRLNQFCNILEERALCLMYLRGLDDARRLWEQRLDPGKPDWTRDFCVPGQVKWTEKREVVSAYLLANKDYWDRPAYYSYVEALKEKYPCNPGI